MTYLAWIVIGLGFFTTIYDTMRSRVASDTAMALSVALLLNLGFFVALLWAGSVVFK